MLLLLVVLGAGCGTSDLDRLCAAGDGVWTLQMIVSEHCSGTSGDLDVHGPTPAAHGTGQGAGGGPANMLGAEIDRQARDRSLIIEIDPGGAVRDAHSPGAGAPRLHRAWLARSGSPRRRAAVRDRAGAA